MITRPQQEIDEIVKWIGEGLMGASHFDGATYEEGFSDAIRWITGETECRPDKPHDKQEQK